jgi:hypothetical protein
MESQETGTSGHICAGKLDRQLRLGAGLLLQHTPADHEADCGTFPGLRPQRMLMQLLPQALFQGGSLS